MIIYQITAVSPGEFNDWNKRIVGNFLYKSKAESEIEGLRKNEKKHHKCWECRYWNQTIMHKPTDIKCERHDPYQPYETSDKWECMNKTCSDNEIIYSIEEVEVNEDKE